MYLQYCFIYTKIFGFNCCIYIMQRIFLYHMKRERENDLTGAYACNIINRYYKTVTQYVKFRISCTTCQVQQTHGTHAADSVSVRERKTGERENR